MGYVAEVDMQTCEKFINQKSLWYTLGPASLNMEGQMLLSGATGVRLTFSFGTPEYQYERAVCIRKAAEQVNRPCYIVADLAGGKLRLGTFQNEPTISARAGQAVFFVPAETIDPLYGGRITLPVPEVSFGSFVSKLRQGSIITIGDGGAVLVVSKIVGDQIIAEMLTDGTLDQKRGLTIQGTDFQPSSLTTKDVQDLKHILATPIYDAIAVSFVSSSQDILEVRQLMCDTPRKIPVVAKIETAKGVANIKEICQCSDIVMAARGDLALAIPWVELPAAVQEIANTARENSTPWILATQIAEGLQRFSIPTRAEICDLANWLEEGCSGILLSYETAFGAKPIAAVECTASILRRWGKQL